MPRIAHVNLKCLHKDVCGRFACSFGGDTEKCLLNPECADRTRKDIGFRPKAMAGSCMGKGKSGKGGGKNKPFAGRSGVLTRTIGASSPIADIRKA